MNKLFAELRRRNVFRVAGVYGVVGWLLAQAATLLETALSLPGWFDAVIVSALLIGFPIALILAWAFEVTPEGVKLTANIAEGESVTAKTGKTLDYVIIAGLALVGVMIIADRLTPSAEPRPHAAAPQDEEQSGAPSDASIAVLPFDDLSPQQDQEYFSDGMAEEILNVLANVQGISVASRTSAFQFKGREIGIPEIARQLNVRHVLEGSVRKAGSTVRITAQLIDTKTDRHLWSETFDRPLTADNVFAIQDEIANAIVSAFQKEVGESGGGGKITIAPVTSNVDAYDLFLRAHQLYLARGQGLREAVLLFEQAVAADPQFARAWAELAAAASVAKSWDVLDRNYNQIALEAANRAIALDPSMSLPYAVKGALHTTDHMPPDFEAGIALLDKALAIDPDNMAALVWRGNDSVIIGQTDDALGYYKKCLELDPDYSICRFQLAMAELTLGHDADSIRDISELMLRGFAGYEPHWADLLLKNGDRVGAAYVALASVGSASAANDLIGALEERNPARRLERLCALKSQYEANTIMGVFLTLQCALIEPVTDYTPIVQFATPYLWLPDYKEYRKSDGFKTMVRELGFPAYWRKHGFPPYCRAIGPQDSENADFECE